MALALCLVLLSPASTPSSTSEPGAAPGPAPGGRPTGESTGVPAGVGLVSHYGDIVVTQPGTVLDGLDIHGFVDIKAADVTIRNSILRGGTATFNRGMVTNYGYDNLVIVDSDFIPEHETVWQDGIKGWDFTARRVHVRGNVDSVKIQGDNVRIEGSLLENSTYYASDPNQGGGATHNDGIQIQKGLNISVVGNTIRGHSNFAILGAASIGATPKLMVSGNWLDGGHCTVKLQELNGHALTVTATDNIFGPNRKVDCPLVATRGSEVTASGNVMEPNGTPVNVYWTDS